MADEAKRYSLDWFIEKVIEGVIVAIALFLLTVAGVGIMQAHLLPDRMDKEGEKMQKKFDEKISVERAASVKREADLIEQLEQLRKDYSTAVLELKRFQAPPLLPPGPGPGLPPPIGGAGPVNPDQHPNWNNIQQQTQIDPEKNKLQYIEKHRK